MPEKGPDALKQVHSVGDPDGKWHQTKNCIENLFWGVDVIPLGLFLAAWKVDSASYKNNIHLGDFNHHNFTPTAGNSKPRFPGPFLAVHPKTEVMGHSSEKKTHHLPHSNPPPKKKNTQTQNVDDFSTNGWVGSPH